MKMQRREVLGGLAAAAGSALLPESSAAGEQTPTPKNLPTERVTGIGGVFFRARDPKALAQWYQDHLGVTGQVWTQEAGPTAFTLCREDGLRRRRDEAVDDQLPRERSGQDGPEARGGRHRGEGGPHDVSERRPLCAHSRSGRKPDRAVAADEIGEVSALPTLTDNPGPDDTAVRHRRDLVAARPRCSDPSTATPSPQSRARRTGST